MQTNSVSEFRLSGLKLDLNSFFRREPSFTFLGKVLPLCLGSGKMTAGVVEPASSD